MILRLDRRYPLVWRSPTSLQLGVDDPPVTLADVTIAEERMLAALTVGATRPGLSLIGTESGLSERQVAQFHRRVFAALEKPDSAEESSIVISGTGPTVDRLAWRLSEAGLVPRLVGVRPDSAVSTPALCSVPFAIAVAHYVLDPEFYGLWLRRDIPHLPVVFGDTSVRIGPVIEPGKGPCLYCLDRQRTDADPAWPAIASQLWGTRSTAEVPFVASEVATIAARLTLRFVRELPYAVATSFTLDVATGDVTPRHWLPHPECACSGIAGAAGFSAESVVAASVEAASVGAASVGAGPVGAGPVRPGTGTARSRRRVARPTATTRGAVASVPA